MGARSRSVLSVLVSILWICSGLLVRADELPPSGLAGSDFTLRSWGAAEGLPGMVRAITQAADGYLWAGTLNGLARFDGVRFETYSAANTPELFSDTINVVYESRARALWIGTIDGGIVRYEHGQFDLFSNAEGLHSITINAIAEDGDGVLWAGTAGGLHRMISSNRFERISSSIVPVEVIVGLRSTAEGDLWVVTLEAVRLLRHGHVIEGPIHMPRVIRCFEIDRSGDLLVGFEGGGIARVSVGKPLSMHEKLAADATALFRDRSGTLWLGSSTGEVWRQDISGQWQHVATRGTSKIVALGEDSQGNLWIGAEGADLCRLGKKLLRTYSTEQGPVPTQFTSLVEDTQGRIWAGTMGRGLLTWQENRFAEVPISAHAINVTSVICDRGGALICGTMHVHFGELYRSATNNLFVPERTFGKQARTLFEDRDGGLWIGKWRGGVEHYKDGRVTKYIPTNGLSNDRILCITQDRQGDIWIGTLNGLNRLSNGKTTAFSQKDGLGGSNVRALFVDHEGTLWAGLNGGGLTRYKNGRFSTITTHHGLISDRIEQILEDDENNLWLGSSAGLMRASLRDLNDCASGNISYFHCAIFQPEEGLGAANTGTGFQPSCLKTRSGELWFASDSGIIVIDPKQIHANTNPPLVHIENLSVDGKINQLYPPQSSGVTVPPGRQRLEFRYTAIDLSAPAAVRFHCKLEGYDRDWLNVDSRREVVYTDVPSGKYQFRVMAVNNYGARNEGGASLGLVILPFWWETRAFQVAVSGVLLGSIVLLIWGFAVRKHRREMEALERRHALESERSRIARDMHDGIGASLVKISLLGELAQRRVSEPDHGEAQLRKITSTARAVVREMDEIVWAVDPRNDTLDGFAGYLCQFSIEHFQDTSVDCRLEVPVELPACSVSANVRHNLLLATREALNNVLKHANATRVSLTVTFHYPMLVITIEDNGCGYPKGDPHGGNGLGNMRQRMDLIGGRVIFSNGADRGACVSFEIGLT